MELWQSLNDTGYTGYRTAGNERTAFLKAIALLLMVADHVGVIFFPDVREWRVIGRLAFPLYAWCLVVGMGYTRNPIRYSVRLLFMACVSQFFYMKALGHTVMEWNVMATLLTGQLAVYGMQRRRCGSEYWAVAAALFATLVFKMDYGFKGVLLIILLYFAKDTRRGIAAVMIAYCLFWGEGTALVSKLFGFDFSFLKTLTKYSASTYQYVFRLQNFAVLSLLLILLPVGWKKRFPNWLGYLAYPGHLLILWLLRLALG